MEESDARENMPGDDVTCDHICILVQRHSPSRISSLVVSVKYVLLQTGEK